MLQNYLELSVNEFYTLYQIRTPPCQFQTNCTPCASIYCTPCVFFLKGVHFRLLTLSFFGFFLSFEQRHINRKSPPYSLNMKGLSYFWNLLS